MKNAKKLKWEGYSIKCNLQAAVTIHIKLTPRNLLISCVTNKDSSKTHTKNLRLFSYYSIHCLHKVIHFVRELSLGKYFSKISIKTKKYTHTDTQTLLNGAYPHTHTHTHTTQWSLPRLILYFLHLLSGSILSTSVFKASDIICPTEFYSQQPRFYICSTTGPKSFV